MIVKDRAGGIWTELLVRKKSPNMVCRQAFVPNKAGMRTIGNEIISAIRGSNKHKFVITRQNGRMRINTFPNGIYSTGILRHRSPDGSEMTELSDVTLRIRKYVKDISRGKTFLLRETSRNIYWGLHIKNVSIGNMYGHLTIGWEGEAEEIVKKQESGFETINPAIMYLGVYTPNTRVKVPPRWICGYSDELIDNLRNLQYSIIDAICQ